ncbi:STAS-like domain-containing protein [Algoriphagus aquimarinus]|uniref:DUF4325 domain-containing protein n=1 Tax=Algoriphagus aquimarinus TaxID=237018 RepID=A0A1I1AIH0_9BACT|nr:STAS-like domain-containing protein [Algoriphagus aquimarinus]SFB36133.1 hypothetical protein SAMN04489723_10845 [Algoriphagus aquimarinus]
MIIDEINIANDFSDTPGARYKKDGPFSGEEFLEKHLRPKFINGLKENGEILIVLDNVWGYPSSFVSGSFGKLSIEYSSETVLKHLKFKSIDSRTRLEKIIYEINNPTRK